MTPARPTASRSARKKYGSRSGVMAGRRTRNFWCRTACASISATAWVSAVEQLHEGLAGAIQVLPREVSRSCRRDRSHAKARTAGRIGTQNCRVFAADAKGSGDARFSGKVLNAIAAHYPWLIGGAADLAPSTKTRLTFEGAGDLEADNTGRPQFALRHPRACHGRDREWAGAVQDSRLRLELSHLFRLYEAADPA